MIIQSTLPADQISLSNPDAPAPPEVISLEGPSINQLPSEQTATTKAIKTHIAQDDKSPGFEPIRAAILSGQEGQIREQMAAAKDISDHQTRMDLVQQIAGDRAKAGKPLEKEDVENIAALSSVDLRNNPATIIEKEYANRYMTKMAALRDGKNIINDAAKTQLAEVSDEMNAASNIKMRQEIVKTRIQNEETKWADSSLGSKAWNVAGTFVPLLENYRTHNVVKGAPGSSILPGNNMEDQVQFLWALAPQDFHIAFNTAMDDLASKNPLMAMTFANKVLEFSSADKLLDNAFGILDAATLPGIGTAAKLGGKGAEAAAKLTLNDVKVALKHAVKADATVNPKPIEEIMNLTGDIAASARTAAYKDAIAEFNKQDPLLQSGRLKASVPTIFNVERILEGSQSLGAEAARRLSDTLQKNASHLLEALTGTTKIARSADEAVMIGLRDAEARLKDMYGHLNDAVLDMRHVTAESQLTNVHELEMQLGEHIGTAKKIAGNETAIGQLDATLFANPRRADYWAHEIYRLKPGEYNIRQQGVGYYIGVRTAVNETDAGFRDALIQTGYQTPKSAMNTFLGALRTPEDTLSKANRDARHLATHGTQEIHRHAAEVAKEIGTLSNKSLDKLRTMLTANRDETYLEKGTMRRGVYHRDVGSLDRAWQEMFKQNPTEKERAAYFTAVQMNDWDYITRNLGITRDKMRQGIENWSFNHRIIDETSGEAAMVSSRNIEGRLVKDVPWDETHDANIFFYDSKTHEGKVLSKNGMAGDERTAITNAIKLDNYKVIQVANPVDRPWSGKFDPEGRVVNFIVVADPERSALDWQQIKHRPGGHVEYQNEHWVSQPTITKRGDKHVFEGEENVFNFATEAEARKYAERMETGRQLLNDGKLDELELFLHNNLPHDLDQFTKLFMERVLADGSRLPPRFTLTEPFLARKSGQNALEARPDIAKLYDNFDDQIRSPYNLYSQIDKKYTNERDLPIQTVKERQGAGPAFQLENAAVIDPLTAMNRGLSNVMRSRYLADYKHLSVETFIQEFGHLMKVEGGLDEIRQNPVYYLHNAVFDNKAPRDQVAAAQNAQRAIVNLLGTQSDVSQNLSWAKQSLMDHIYSQGGQKASDFVADHLLHRLEDPSKYARNIAFHSKLGLFNPVQMFLQAQTVVHTAALTGLTNTYKGMAGFTLMRGLSLTADKATVNHFAEMATKIGWKKEDFLESYAALKKTGLYNVEGEVAFKDDVFDPKLFNGAVGKFLDKGTFFFREGERMTRLVSWNAAYLEWKAANPGRVLNDKGISEILTRQNTLSLNMTRASNSAWQQGAWSIPTQFFAYQARLAEQFLGKRLTDAEKARAFTTYAAMYGVPTATGAVTFAWPWYEDMRASALDRGVDMSPNSPFSRAIMEGIPSTIIAAITGNEQNFAQRSGPGGIKYFREIFKEGKVSQVFGASPNIIMQMAGAVAPVLKATASPFIPGMRDYKYTMADAITAAEEISTVNNVGKAIYALSTGNYISKNEINLGKATPADAVQGLLFGTQPLAISDAFMISDIQKEKKAMQDAVKKEVIKNYRRALNAFANGEDSTAERHLNNMQHQIVGGDFRPDELGKIYQEAMQGHESLVDKMNEKYIKEAPNSKYWDRVNRVFKIKPDGTSN